MARQRRTSSTPSAGQRADGAPARQRPRGDDAARDVPLTEEELRNLAVEEDLDPEDVARILRIRHENLEASDHDRDTARDDLESLTLEERE